MKRTRPPPPANRPRKAAQRPAAAPRLFTVRSLRASASLGLLVCGNLVLRCALGRTGRRAVKREGDGATPLGVLPLLAVLYRADRMRRPRTALPVRSLRPLDGWCDDPADRNYNRFVRHPYPARAERLWREDGLYDLIAVLGANARPRIRGRGSAIFLHAASPGLAPTGGCVALRRNELEKLLAISGKRAAAKIC